jgi:RNA polymerase sigma-70 factor (ECF subfamily)
VRRTSSLSPALAAPADPVVVAPPRPAVGTLEEIYREHAAAVSRWAERLAGPGVDLEDVVHDVFLVVQRRLPEFRGDAKLTTWLYEITIRVVQARRRSLRWRRWLWPFGVVDEDRPERVDPSDEGPTALDALERSQSTALLYRFLEELDEKYRTAVILFELEGLPCEQIAALTGTSVANVWARVSRGRAKLTAAFEAWEARALGSEA